jgi:phage terminase small subunit
VTATEAQRLEENNISATRVLEETRRIALNDPRRFLMADGDVQPITMWTAEMAAAVASIEVVKRNATGADGPTTTVVKLRFWNKNQAIELLAKHLQLLDPEPVNLAAGVPCFIMPEGTGIRIL